MNPINGYIIKKMMEKFSCLKMRRRRKKSAQSLLKSLEINGTLRILKGSQVQHLPNDPTEKIKRNKLAVTNLFLGRAGVQPALFILPKKGK